tara:strand:- start:97 stop:465 length:369 start_codon:yes stop_codon:yes gene_type:complete
MNKEKFFAELKKAKGRTNLKANKVQLGAIDDIWKAIYEMDWDGNLQKVYDKYEVARNYADEVIIDATYEYENIKENLDFVENSLNELGIDLPSSFAETQKEVEKIGNQLEGLKDDINSGVLA